MKEKEYEMKQLAADFVAEFLVKKGIKDVFFIDGSAIASLLVGVAENKNLRYVCPWHEQAGAFAVDGYVKASRRMSVMLATSGPAGQNLINGIAASYYDSFPAMYFTGQINSRFIKPSPDVRQHGFQENDIVSMVKPVTKYAVLIRKPEDLKYELEKHSKEYNYLKKLNSVKFDCMVLNHNQQIHLDL